ncbi:MAG TPA: IS3 family transposase [Candidatus Eremiobacteraceae bacterium]|nr:IS3 family transposase [Candidatus Eremiobacteraceae bacterium]
MRALQTRGISALRACTLAGYARSNLYYRRKPRADEPIASRLQELATQRPRWGWRRLLIVLRREYDGVGEYRFRRIYRGLGLQVRPRKKRKVRYVRGNAIAPVHAPNERWSLDYMHDTLASGRRLRVLVIVDDYTRECLATEVERGFDSRRVIAVLERIGFVRGLPRTLRFDNGAELTSHTMLSWGAEQRIELHFIDPGKPIRNAHVESLNGKARDEFLNIHSFLTLDQARNAAAELLTDYNEVRPNSSLRGRTPKEFADTLLINPSQEPAA